MIKLNISKEEIDIFTDGSCSGNPGPGGWSGVIIHDLISILTGYETNTTNNRMELMATINVIKLLRKINSNVLISIDTSKAMVAKLAMEEGADIVNDVSSYNNDKKMIDVVKKYNSGIILMHMQGTPKNMQKNPLYKDVVSEVLEFIDKKISLSLEYGIKKESIAIDPGIGFGKNLKQNLTLLKSLDKFIQLHPTLVGLSRKSFIGEILKEGDPKKRLAGSLGASAFDVMKGAHIIRVHDVKETSDICKILNNLF